MKACIDRPARRIAGIFLGALALLQPCCGDGHGTPGDGEEDRRSDGDGPRDDPGIEDAPPGEDPEAGCDGDSCGEDAPCDPCPPVCGNASCEAGEDCAACPADCGACLPSCGEAGGDTCTSAATTLCLDLPLLPSRDCEVCCDRPEAPPIVPNSYHYTDMEDTDWYDGILGIADQGAMICSQNRPPAVPPERWCRLISGDTMTAEEIVDTLHHAFQTDPEKPAKVLIDELQESYKDKIRAVAETMASAYPQYAGRWGVFIENTSPDCRDSDPANPCYGSKADAIQALLRANAIIVAELYVGRGAYCNHGGNYGERDIWLASYFAGDMGEQKRFAWLADQKTLLGSSSQLSVILIVIDDSVGTSDAYIYIDRQFYVWATRTGLRSFMLSSNGGLGAYKWQHYNNSGEVAVSSSNRDNLFAESFSHYCVGGSTESRFPGPAFCP